MVSLDRRTYGGFDSSQLEMLIIHRWKDRQRTEKKHNRSNILKANNRGGICSVNIRGAATNLWDNRNEPYTVNIPQYNVMCM